MSSAVRSHCACPSAPKRATKKLYCGSTGKTVPLSVIPGVDAAPETYMPPHGSKLMLPMVFESTSVRTSASSPFVVQAHDA